MLGATIGILAFLAGVVMLFWRRPAPAGAAPGAAGGRFGALGGLNESLCGMCDES